MQIIDCATPYKLVDAKHGKFLVSPMDVYLGLAIINYGEYGEIEWQMLEKFLHPAKDAIEIGSNIGTHTVPMARKLSNTGRRLLAVEPQPIIFQNLCANISLNALFNVVAENMACSDVAGTLSFESVDYRQPNNSGGTSMREDGSGSQRVRSLPLDAIVPDGFDIGLIKIDVEGFEQKVLEGAKETIAKHRPIIYLENDRVESSQALIECLWALNYRVWWHITLLFNPANFAGNTKNIYENAASFNMVAFPREANVAMHGFEPVEDSKKHPLRQSA